MNVVYEKFDTVTISYFWLSPEQNKKVTTLHPALAIPEKLLVFGRQSHKYYNKCYKPFDCPAIIIWMKQFICKQIKSNQNSKYKILEK